jgi:acetolactate synthase-1/2/3 large subunit
MSKCRCATAMVKTLEALGTEVAFVFNGHGNWALLDAIQYESRIRGIACKGEDQAVHMADGYYRSNSKGGLPVVSTSVGPGNMNIAGALVNAFYESSAQLVLAGAGSTHWFDRGGMEEFYRYAPEEWIQTVKTYTKRAFMISRPDTAVEMLLRGYKTAVTGRPGPVVVQVPFDIQHTEIEFSVPQHLKQLVDIYPPGPDPSAVREAARLIANSKRPLVYVSSGVYRAEAFDELAVLLEEFGLPLATTAVGKGAYPEDKPLCLGAAGRAGTGQANLAAAECDVLIAIGTHFTDLDTGGWTLFKIPEGTRLIHIDIDHSEIARVYPTEIGIISDAKLALANLIEDLRSLDVKPDRWAPWRGELDESRKAWENSVTDTKHSDKSPLNYGRLCHEVSRTVNEFDPESTIFVDTGHLLSFAPAFYRAVKPKFFHNGFYHRMGWSLPAAFGSRIAHPEHPSVALLGDGSFLFSAATLATAYEYETPVVAVVLNNRSLQIERELMERSYGRTAFTDFVRESTQEPWSPDIVGIAEAMGSKAKKVTKPAELAPALKEALQSNSPYVLDVDIDISVPGYRSIWYPYPKNFYLSREDNPKKY